MRRLLLVVAVVLVGCGAAAAQLRDPAFRLGFLAPSPRALESLRTHTLPELAKQGFVEGRNLTLHARVGTGDHLPGLASELVALKPDAIIVIANRATAAVRQATNAIPIVMMASAEEQGLAASVARPAANVTGLDVAPELDLKRLHLLHEAAPVARRHALLNHSLVPTLEARKADFRKAAAVAGVEPMFFEASGREAYEGAFAAMRAAGTGALVIGGEPQFRNDIGVLARLAIEAGLPTACHWRDMAEGGCLLSFGPSLPALYRRVAEPVARIFKGAAPGDLPIEAPDRFELVVNLKTAKALGLTIPESLLLQATEVIE